MNKMILLIEALRPRGDRDQCGDGGELMHKLADSLEELGHEEMVYQSSTSDQLADFLKTLELPDEHRWLQQQVVSLLRERSNHIPMTLGEL